MFSMKMRIICVQSVFLQLFIKQVVLAKTPGQGIGGEYGVQTNFGWTNGVILDLLYTYGGRLSAPVAGITNVCDNTNTNNSYIYCYGRILEAVNHFGYYKDAKTFVDMPLKYHPDKTLKNFNTKFPTSVKISEIDNSTLAAFIQQHFLEPGTELLKCKSADWKPKPAKFSVIKDPAYNEWAHKLHNIWSKLCKKINESVQDKPEMYSLIYVPHPFIAPGGRFREFYYWDTYWIVRGLLVSEMYQTVKNMIRNFASMVDRYGFVPNGGRVYYLQRSQPPLFIPMVYEYLMATKTLDIDFLQEILPSLEKGNPLIIYITSFGGKLRMSGLAHAQTIHS